MKFDFRKTAAGALAAALALSLCGCGDRGYIMTVDGMDIRNGVYLSYQQTSYTLAGQKIDERDKETSSDASDTSGSEDIFTESIDGKSASDWIKEETLRQVRKFVAVQRICADYGISLSDEEISRINSDVQAVWDKNDFYVQYLYGFNTMGEYYESKGIAIDSMKEIQRTNALSEKLFMHYYGKDGIIPATDEEINAYLKDNHASVKMLQLNYKDYKGDDLASDADKQTVKDKAKAYAERLNGGESFIDVKYDFDLQAARDSAKANAENTYTEDNEEKLSKDDYVKKAVDAAQVTKAASLDDIDRFISKEDSSLNEELTEFIWNTAADGKAVVFEGESAAYVIVREDITKKSKWIEENYSTILNSVKGGEYDSMLELTYQNYEVELNEYSVNTKYAPEKLYKTEQK